jgi:hypothetical protein
MVGHLLLTARGIVLRIFHAVCYRSRVTVSLRSVVTESSGSYGSFSCIFVVARFGSVAVVHFTSIPAVGIGSLMVVCLKSFVALRPRSFLAAACVHRNHSTIAAKSRTPRGTGGNGVMKRGPSAKGFAGTGGGSEK